MPRFNALLKEARNMLGQRMVDTTIVFIDMFAIKYDLVVHHMMHDTYNNLYYCSIIVFHLYLI
jgi:hypothetical protein